MLQIFPSPASATVTTQVASEMQADLIGVSDAESTTKHKDNVVVEQFHETSEVNRLLTAAAINPRFRRLLLNDPATAIAHGYHQEHFQLTATEITAICTIRATSLTAFADALYRLMKTDDRHTAIGHR